MRLRVGREGLPAGPSMPGILHALRWTSSPDPFLRRCLERYGTEFTLRLPGVGPTGFNDIVFLADPVAIKEVFTGGAALSRVGYARRPLQAMFGTSSLITVDGARHLRHRKLLLPAFHGERLQAYEQAMAQITVEEIERWPFDRPFRMQARTQSITLEIILRVVFGLEDPQRRAAVRDQIRDLLDIVAHPAVDLLMGLPGRVGPINIRAQVENRIAKTDQTLLAEIRRQRTDPQLEQRTDVLALLLQARDEQGEGLNDEELRDQLVTLLLAGHETTATALAWTFELLFRHPAEHERVRSEIRDQGIESPYLDAVIKEVLRLRPPLAMCDRVLEQPFVVGSRILPEGTIIAPCIYLVHRRADLYPLPDQFRPERFLETEIESYAWIPFGGGMRRCIGASFAMLEMKIVLEQILRRTTLCSATRKPEPMRRRAIVLAPKSGTPTRLLKRGPERTSGLLTTV